MFNVCRHIMTKDSASQGIGSIGSNVLCIGPLYPLLIAKANSNNFDGWICQECFHVLETSLHSKACSEFVRPSPCTRYHTANNRVGQGQQGFSELLSHRSSAQDPPANSFQRFTPCAHL